MFDFAACPAAASPLPAAAIAAVPAMRRPRLLVRAAEAGVALYRRERDLKAVLPAMAVPARRARDIAARLAPIEAELDAARRAGAPDYRPRRHVAVLSALLAERAAARRGKASR